MLRIVFAEILSHNSSAAIEKKKTEIYPSTKPKVDFFPRLIQKNCESKPNFYEI